jgi:hypothetical protein
MNMVAGMGSWPVQTAAVVRGEPVDRFERRDIPSNRPMKLAVA